MIESEPSGNSHVARYALGVGGGVVGGAAGYFIFAWLVGQQFYALMVPGAMLGLGCSMASRIRSRGLGIACAVAAIGLGIFSEWKMFPFRDDGSFTFFLQNLSQLKPFTWITIALGGLCAYWIGTGKDQPRSR